MIEAIALAIVGMIQGACTWEYDRYDEDRRAVFRAFLCGATARGWGLAPFIIDGELAHCDWTGAQ